MQKIQDNVNTGTRAQVPRRRAAETSARLVGGVGCGEDLVESPCLSPLSVFEATHANALRDVEGASAPDVVPAEVEDSQRHVARHDVADPLRCVLLKPEEEPTVRDRMRDAWRPYGAEVTCLRLTHCAADRVFAASRSPPVVCKTFLRPGLSNRYLHMRVALNKIRYTTLEKICNSSEDLPRLLN